MVTSEEYHEKNRDFAHSNERNLVIKEIAADLRLWIDLSDHAIGINILRGRYELNELDFIRHTVRPGQHVVDCGAHIGYFAMHLADAVGPTGSVSAFEPFPPTPSASNGPFVRTTSRVASVWNARPSAPHPARCRWSTLPIRSTAAAHFFRDQAKSPWDTRPGRSPWLRSTGGPATAHQLHQGRHRRRRAAGIPRRRRPAPGRPPGDPVGTTPLAARPRLRCHARPVHRGDGHARGYRCHLLGAGVPGEEINDAPNNGVTSVVFLPAR